MKIHVPKDDVYEVSWLLVLAAIGFLIAMMLSGCAHFSSQQVETAKDGTQRTTTIRVFTFLDSKSELSRLRAQTTDKTQGMTLAGLSDTSSSTNLVAVLQLIAAISGSAIKP